ncbi:MAG TPA: GH25 family lysozyme [Pseudonocardiaceae bacterium]
MRVPTLLAGLALAATAVLAVAGPAAAAPPPNTVTGVAVGGGDTNLDWAQLKAQGVEFAYVEDTTGTSSNNPLFKAQSQGARGVGMFVGAVHFALPNSSSGTTQADYFVANGGTWTANSSTLPPVLDIEYNPFGGSACYGLSSAAMVDWISQFVTEVHAKTTRWPVIYTETAWWSQCTGNLRSFSANDPLWTTRSDSGSAALPYNWTATTFLSEPTDALHAYYNGSLAGLTRFADD